MQNIDAVIFQAKHELSARIAFYLLQTIRSFSFN